MAVNRVFVDSSVWVYAIDSAAGTKQRRAQEVLAKLSTERIVISTQVMDEFFVVATERLKEPLSHEQAMTALREMARLSVVSTDATLVLRAAELSAKHHMSHWDALLLSCAIRGGCSEVLTEDLEPGMRAGILVSSPFPPFG